MALEPNPYSTTRENWTSFFVHKECPANAVRRWRRIFLTHQRMLDLLAHDPAMEQNLQQTYMTPANSKNKVYFMWDFIGRTLGMLTRIPPDSPRGPDWNDVQGRAVFAQMLIKDTTGKLDDMLRGVGYGVDPKLKFSEEILGVADELEEW